MKALQVHKRRSKRKGGHRLHFETETVGEQAEQNFLGAKRAGEVIRSRN